MRNPWGEAPFAALLSCLVLGIACSRFVHFYWFLLLAASACLLIAASVIALRRGRLQLALWPVLTVLFLCGLMLALARRDAYPESDLRAILSRSEYPLDQPLLFEGCVAEEVRQYDDEIVTTIELRGYQRQNRWTTCQGRGLIEVPANPAPGEQIPGADLRMGDRVRGWGIWHRPRNYKNPGAQDRVGSLALRDIFLIGRIKSARLLEVIPQD